MFPDGNVFTDTSTAPELLPPFNITENDSISYSYGGVALNNPFQGLKVYIWKARLSNSKVYISNSSDNFVSETLFYSHDASVERVNLSFDNNMQPILLLYYQNTAVIRFYDGGVSDFVFQTVANVRGARAVMDYPWRGGNEIRDTLVCYVRNDNNMLCYRRSRDRYLFEYEIRMLHKWQTLRGLYVTTDKRIAFQFGWNPYRQV